MREDVQFDADGVTLHGWLYTPDGSSGLAPAIVMTHGFSAVKEMYLDRFAEAFANAGLAGLLYDNRNFGASGGEPRQEIDPWAQVRDYRTAITYAASRPEVDSDRIGIWGSSYSGGHVLVLGAIDRRVKCVTSQVPLVSGHENFRRLVRADFIPGFHAQFDLDRTARFRGDPPMMVPVVDADPLAPSALPTPDSYKWFTETHETRAPSWRNEVTLRSVEMFTEYEPGTRLHEALDDIPPIEFEQRHATHRARDRLVFGQRIGRGDLAEGRGRAQDASLLDARRRSRRQQPDSGHQRHRRPERSRSGRPSRGRTPDRDPRPLRPAVQRDTR